MKRSGTAALLALVLSAAVTSCNYGFQFGWRENSIEDRITGLSSAELGSPTTKDAYQVAVMTDVHFGKSGHDTHYDDLFVAWVGRHKADIEFVVCLGDVADGGHAAEYCGYRDFVNRIEAVLNDGDASGTGKKRVYTAVGNHDLYNDGWNEWKKYVNVNDDFALDRSFFTFRTNQFHWYFIDSASDSLGTAQFKALKERMRQDSGPKIVCSHIPIYSNGYSLANYPTLQNPEETTRLITLFASTGTKLYIAGHQHFHTENDFGRFREVVFPALVTNGHEWGVLTVNETAGTVSARVVSPGDD